MCIFTKAMHLSRIYEIKKKVIILILYLTPTIAMKIMCLQNLRLFEVHNASKPRRLIEEVFKNFIYNLEPQYTNCINCTIVQKCSL